MTAPIRVLLVGYGLAGRYFHAPLITATDGLTLTGVVSSDAAKVRADLPEALVSATLDEALGDASIELVVIATPDDLHAPQALQTLDSGRHVVIDKPFAPTLEEAERVALSAKQSGRLATVFHSRRWDADFLTIRRLIHEGALGEVMQFESRYERWRPVVVDRWKERAGGGVWQDLGPHLVDQALQLFGMPESVLGDIGVQRRGGVAPDYAHVTLGYAGGLRAILHASQLSHDSGLRFVVHGSEGSYVKHGMDPQENQSKAGMSPSHHGWGIDPAPGLLTYVCGDGDPMVRPVPSERGDYAAFYRGVRDAIRDGREGPVTLHDALNVMKVLEAANLSAHTGGRICPN